MSLKIWLDKATKLNERFLEVKALLEKHTGSRETFTKLIDEERSRITDFDLEVANCDQVINLLQLVLDNARGQVDKIENICSEALQSILNDPSIKFKIKLDKKKIYTDTNFFIEDSKVGEVDLMKGEAGGTKNIVSIALRLIFAELYSPRIDGPIIFDEAGGNISTDHQSNFGKFLNKFSHSANRQTILITHHLPVIDEADKKIRVSKKAGESIIA